MSFIITCLKVNLLIFILSKDKVKNTKISEMQFVAQETFFFLKRDFQQLHRKQLHRLNIRQSSAYLGTGTIAHPNIRLHIQLKSEFIPRSVQDCWKEEPAADPADSGFSTRLEER